MRKHTAEETAAISLRLNRNLLEEIRIAAARQDRSINNYLLQILSQQMQRERKSAANKAE